MNSWANTKVRHGTLAGHSMHYWQGEKPCDPCRAAKSEYDARRLANDPELLDQTRLRARAATKARVRIIAQHRDEYRALYSEECAKLGLTPRYKRGSS